jgi:REP element-mobilizing transposase RayT
LRKHQQSFVRLAKQRAGYRFTQAHHQRLWQDSFFDRTLRQEDELADVIAYVVNNPVRAGLVADPSEYGFWGSQTYSREEILEFVQISRRV